MWCGVLAARGLSEGVGASPRDGESQSVGGSVVSSSLPPLGLQPARLLCPWDSPGQNTGVGSHSCLQGIFPTQGSNPGLLYCRQILCHLRLGGRWRLVVNSCRRASSRMERRNCHFALPPWMVQGFWFLGWRSGLVLVQELVIWAWVLSLGLLAMIVFLGEMCFEFQTP